MTRTAPASKFTYEKYLRVSLRLQREYIRGEQKRMREARRLVDLYIAAMGSIEFHPLSLNEIVDRQKQLDRMAREAVKTHGDNEAQRIHFRMLQAQAA